MQRILEGIRGVESPEMADEEDEDSACSVGCFIGLGGMSLMIALAMAVALYFFCMRFCCSQCECECQWRVCQRPWDDEDPKDPTKPWPQSDGASMASESETALDVDVDYESEFDDPWWDMEV